MSVSTTFMIVGKNDTPLYEVDLGGGTSSRVGEKGLSEFFTRRLPLLMPSRSLSRHPLTPSRCAVSQTQRHVVHRCVCGCVIDVLVCCLSVCMWWLCVAEQDQGAHLRQFVLHAALDIVDELVWKSSALFLKTVDRYQNMYISAMVSPGNVRLLLLHEQRTDEGTVKQFFQDVHELYLKVLLNPFYQLNGPITSVSFDARVKGLARRLRS
jgi:trafficking protein particle complex subunit 2